AHWRFIVRSGPYLTSTILASGLQSAHTFVYFPRCITLRYPWSGILMYEMAFLRKYQQSYDFNDWAEVRNELFTYHITRATILPRPQSSKSPSHQPSDTTCKNFNSP